MDRHISSPVDTLRKDIKEKRVDTKLEDRVIAIANKTLDECIGDCKMCHHARYYEWATDDDDFYCDLEEGERK